MFYYTSQIWWMSSTVNTGVLHSYPVTISPSFCEYQASSKELDVIHIPTHSLDMFEARLPRFISVSQIVCTELAKDESQSSHFVLTSALAAWWCFGLVLCVCGFHAWVFSSFSHLVCAGHWSYIKTLRASCQDCQHLHLVITNLMMGRAQQRPLNPQHARTQSNVCPWLALCLIYMASFWNKAFPWPKRAPTLAASHRNIE